MNVIRSAFGSVKSTYNSINPATLSGAIDVVVVEHEDGTLACSPFHVRFGKYQILRPSDKKVEFKVNNVKQNLPMKLGEGGEAFFVFETNEHIPIDLQTSPLVSPETSPQTSPSQNTPALRLPEPEPLDLANDTQRARSVSPEKGRPSVSLGPQDAHTDHSALAVTGQQTATLHQRPISGDWSGVATPHDAMSRSITDETLKERRESISRLYAKSSSMAPEDLGAEETNNLERTPSAVDEDLARATALSKKLWSFNIASKVTEEGDLMLDMAGYSDSEADAIKVEAAARKVLAEELAEEDGGNHDIGSRIGLDENGNIWVYHSEEAKAAADRRANLHALNYSAAIRPFDALSDPGYHSDEEPQSDGERESSKMNVDRFRRDSDSAVGVSTPPDSPALGSQPTSSGKSYAKTLRLTSDQLKQLDLKPGANPMTFTVNKSICPAFIYLWRYNVPIVISDIDGTITKSDALGHLFNAIGRDWTHLGVAKLYTDIASNGYNILYLTSRSVGQADTTRNYLNGVVQDGYRLPKGAVIMSPDRTYAALRREVYLRKPEVFKMACLRDIMSLFQTAATENHPRTPFYAGFGNRITDAMSYRSVSIPSTRIFTIDSYARVSMFLLAADLYQTSYVTMRELVDHYFPPLGFRVREGGEEYTDFNFWRDRPLSVDEFSDSESGNDDDEDDDEEEGYEDDGRPSIDESVRSEDEAGEDMEASFYSQASIDDDGVTEEEISSEMAESIFQSIENGNTSVVLDEQLLVNDPGEIEVEDMSGQLSALDLAAEATPHVRPLDDPVQDDLKELSKVLSSPERAEHRRATD